MKIVQEFRQFIQRGNVIDLAVGVIMGAAFGKIVNSLVADILMPPIGYVIGGVKFTELKLVLPARTIPEIGTKLEPAAINYGQFLQASIDFIIVAFCVFLLVKGINAFYRHKQEPSPALPTPTEKLLTEIRDLLQAEARSRDGGNSPAS